MEQRLLQIIKEGKGEIKQLLEAEKELGVWRTKIEEFEGEIRYYSHLAAFEHADHHSDREGHPRRGGDHRT